MKTKSNSSFIKNQEHYSKIVYAWAQKYRWHYQAYKKQLDELISMLAFQETKK